MPFTVAAGLGRGMKQNALKLEEHFRVMDEQKSKEAPPRLIEDSPNENLAFGARR